MNYTPYIAETQTRPVGTEAALAEVQKAPNPFQKEAVAQRYDWIDPDLNKRVRAHLAASGCQEVVPPIEATANGHAPCAGGRVAALRERHPNLRFSMRHADGKTQKGWQDIVRPSDPKEWPAGWAKAEWFAVQPASAGLFVADVDKALNSDFTERAGKVTKAEAEELAEALGGGARVYESTPGKGTWHILFAASDNGGSDWTPANGIKGGSASGFSSQGGLLWKTAAGDWLQFDTRGGGVGHDGKQKGCNIKLDRRRCEEWLAAGDEPVRPVANPKLLGQAFADRKKHEQHLKATGEKAAHALILEGTAAIMKADLRGEDLKKAKKDLVAEATALRRGKGKRTDDIEAEVERAYEGIVRKGLGNRAEATGWEKPWSIESAAGAPVVQAKDAFAAHTSMADIFLMHHHENARYDITTHMWVRWHPAFRRWICGTAGNSYAYQNMEELAELHISNASDRKSFLRSSQYRGALEVASNRPGVMVATATDISADPDIPAFDRNMDILGLPDGYVYDLKTGKKREAERDDLISMYMGCAPEEGEPTAWLKFLEEALCDFGSETGQAIEALRRFLRKGLEGRASDDEDFVFAQGKAGTGKSTLVGTVLALFGTYAVSLSGARLVAETSAHRQWLMRIPNKRMAVVTELPGGDGRRGDATWNSELVNALVSGEPIEANRMRQNSIEFEPVAQLMVAGNERPSTSNEGIIRRMCLLSMQTAPLEPNTDLKRQLRQDELPRIFNWVLGANMAAEWPSQIAESKQQYRTDANPLAAFLHEKCVFGPDKSASATKLFKAYLEWCADNGHKNPRTQTSFGRSIGDSYPRFRRDGAVWYTGLALLF